MSVTHMFAMRALSRVAACILAAVSVSACAASGGEMGEIDVASEEQAIELLLEQRGFDATTVRFEQHEVRVEGDIIFDRTELLAEAAELVEKGYTRITPKTVNGKKIYGFAGGACVYHSRAQLGAAWSDALAYAVGKWREQGVTIQMGGQPVDNRCLLPTSLQVTKVDLGDRFIYADATYGTANGFGNRLRINSGFWMNTGESATNARCENTKSDDLPLNVKRMILMHELGHTMTMAHPNEFNHISGTASGSDYNTVMLSGCLGRTELGSDDKASIKRLMERN